MLSRNIGTPNIASKGKLLPRTVQVPAAMLPALTGAPSASQNPTQLPSKPLIEEVSTLTDLVASSPTSSPNAGDATLLPGLRGILKKRTPSASGPSTEIATGKRETPIEDTPLDWSWMKDEEGRLRVEVYVPGLVSSSSNPSQILSFLMPPNHRRIPSSNLPPSISKHGGSYSPSRADVFSTSTSGCPTPN